jgi:hypothetical protein
MRQSRPSGRGSVWFGLCSPWQFRTPIFNGRQIQKRLRRAAKGDFNEAWLQGRRSRGILRSLRVLLFKNAQFSQKQTKKTKEPGRGSRTESFNEQTLSGASEKICQNASLTPFRGRSGIWFLESPQGGGQRGQIKAIEIVGGLETAR